MDNFEATTILTSSVIDEADFHIAPDLRTKAKVLTFDPPVIALALELARYAAPLWLSANTDKSLADAVRFDYLMANYFAANDNHKDFYDRAGLADYLGRLAVFATWYDSRRQPTTQTGHLAS